MLPTDFDVFAWGVSAYFCVLIGVFAWVFLRISAYCNTVFPTLLQPEELSVKSTPSDAIQKPREGDTDREVEGIDMESEDMANAATSEKTDKDQDQVKDAGFDKLVPQDGLSTEDPAAAEAYEKYLTAESEYLAAHDALKAALDARPIDWGPYRIRNQ